VFDNKEAAIEYLKKCSFPIVVKADGLALGKGVIIAKSYEEAEDAVNSMMSDKLFGCAGDKIVIEEFLEGQEVTVLAFADGKTVVPMVSAQDHKRAFDNDEGLNTGGMGAFSPSRLYTDELQSYCLEKIYLPTLEAMRRENRKFKGVLYFGMILTDDGPKVLEYNARFGDPETQVILPRLETDIIDIFNAVIDEKLDSVKIKWKDNSAVCVILASGGYPGKYQTGLKIEGIEEAEKDTSVVVFHAGTKICEGSYFTSGGRVLGVTAVAGSLGKAVERAYEAVEKISFPNMHFRKDIGKKALMGGGIEG
jgi:phosphoribosylamine--glycine ligase